MKGMKGMKRKGVPPGSPGVPSIGKSLPAERMAGKVKGRKALKRGKR